MARFQGKNILFRNTQRAIFGDNEDSYIEWDEAGNQLEISTVVSGVHPTEDHHLTTKYYIDNTITSGINSHNDDSTAHQHTEYIQFSTNTLVLHKTSKPEYSYDGPLGVLLFDDANEEYSYGSFKIPFCYKADTDITAEIHYVNGELQAGANSCVWSLDYMSFSDGDIYGDKVTDTISITDTLSNNAAEGTFNITADMTITYSGVNNPLSKGKTVSFKLYRDSDNAADTMTGDAGFVLLVFKLSAEVGT